LTLANFMDADTRAMLAVVFGQFAARVAHLGAFVAPAWISIRAAAYLEREPRSLSARRETVLAVFVLYLVVVAALTIVPLQPRAVSGVGIVSLIPGRTTFGCYRQMTGTPVEVVICNMQLLGNIALFIPMGLLLPLVWHERRSALATISAALAGSVTIEVIQYLQQSMGMKRSVDIDDVILNVVGASIGYLLVRLLVQKRPGASRPIASRT
jgi:glycopeptide antibiotics resistance protein